MAEMNTFLVLWSNILGIVTSAKFIGPPNSAPNCIIDSRKLRKCPDVVVMVRSVIMNEEINPMFNTV